MQFATKSLIFAAAVFAMAFLAAPQAATAGTSVVSHKDDHLFLGLMLREACVETFPRFAKAAAVLDSKPYLERRAGKQVWDHTNHAALISLERVDGKAACVMRLVVKRFRDGDWASYAVPVFGATWESDQTIVDKGEAHPGDKFGQHIVVRFPTGERFKFDADRRDDRLWSYTISLIAK